MGCPERSLGGPEPLALLLSLYILKESQSVPSPPCPYSPSFLMAPHSRRHTREPHSAMRRSGGKEGRTRYHHICPGLAASCSQGSGKTVGLRGPRCGSPRDSLRQPGCIRLSSGTLSAAGRLAAPCPSEPSHFSARPVSASRPMPAVWVGPCPFQGSVLGEGGTELRGPGPTLLQPEGFVPHAELW